MNPGVAAILGVAAGFVLAVVFDPKVVKAIKSLEAGLQLELARVRSRLAAIEAAVKGR